MRRLVALAVAVAAFAIPAVAHASQGMLVGAAEDAAKAPTLAQAKVKMDLAKLAGFDAIRLTAQWRTGQTAPLSSDLAGLKNAADAADLDGVAGLPLRLSLWQLGDTRSSTSATSRSSSDGSRASSTPTTRRSPASRSSSTPSPPCAPASSPAARPGQRRPRCARARSRQKK